MTDGPDVSIVAGTPNADQVVVRAGRGDMYDGWTGVPGGVESLSVRGPYESGRDTSFESGPSLSQLLDDVAEPKERHYREAMRVCGYDEPDEDTEISDITDPELDFHAKVVRMIHTFFDREHWGVFEHPQITIALRGLSRSAMAQITRHRHLSFDVQSQRYVDFSDKKTIVPKSITDEDHAARGEGVVDVDTDAAREIYERATENSKLAYQNLLDAGVPEEDARFVMMEGTPVNMTVSGNARAFMHVVNLRQKPNAQWEAQATANAIYDALVEWMPITFRHFERKAPLRNGI